MDSRDKIKELIKILGKKYKIKVKRDEPFKVLITTILSQRTKDEVTDLAAERLFRKADTPEKMIRLGISEIEKLIYPVGFYKKKAKGIIELSRYLIKKHKGNVPRTLEELVKIPFVGDKTASCILLFGFGRNTIPVDTHVNRISKRIGLVGKNLSPERVRLELEKIIKGKERAIINQLFIRFGKDICRPVRPSCEVCQVTFLCKYFQSRRNSLESSNHK